MHWFKRILGVLLLAVLGFGMLSGPTLAQAYQPAKIANCGIDTTYAASPKRAVTMNQAATEIMLALGLEDHMIGTAYLDDPILPEFKTAYAKVPVLAKQYPSKEILFGVTPDFIYGSYSSAFEDDAAGSRDDLAKLDINTYVSPVACKDKNLRPKKVTLDNIYGEITDIGAIFGVPDRAEKVVAAMKAQVKAAQDAIGKVDKPLSIFWYDSENPPFTAACCGIPQNIMALVGAENIFDDLDGSWANATWEAVVDRNPAVIVLIQADWSTAKEKQDLLSAPAYADITAVKNSRYITIDFSYTTAGIRNAAAVEMLARGLYPDKFPALPMPEATAAATRAATVSK